ncbi:MAG: ATP-binding protein [Methylophaga sp.]|nr:ATP-binding protein [Methylophaga sp.]
MSQDTVRPKTLSLIIKNQTSEIARMSLWLTGSLGRCGLSREMQFKFDLCANEAVTNIISYGYPRGGEHDINLQLQVETDSAILTIEDDGIAFNPTENPAHVQPESLQEAKVGGLGIDLIRHYMDQVCYRRTAGLNRLSMQMKLAES